MTEPAFSPDVSKALDSYTVPPVPSGFSDRLMARVLSGDTGEVVAPAPIPTQKRRSNSPWRRTSRIVGAVAMFSLATATAAAAGIFGKPVYMPGITEALVEAKIVQTPKPVARPQARAVAEIPAVDPAAPRALTTTTGSAAIVSKVTELRNDAEYAKLAPREKLRVAGKEVRQMVKSGEASRQDVRAAVRELAQDADPAAKEAWRKAAANRRAQRLERREALRNGTPEERAAMRDALRERRAARLQQTDVGTDPAP
ncbi:MAG: hypothetical protein ACK4ZE_08905 [Sphingorhabdus sp.]